MVAATRMLRVAMLEQLVIDAEHAHGLVPADAARPTLPHERNVDFAGIDTILTHGYQTAAQALDELRNAILDGLTEAISAGDDAVAVARSLRQFAANQPPAVRTAVANAVDDIARSLAAVHNQAGELMLAEAYRQARTPRAPLTKATAAQYTAAAEIGPDIMWQRVNVAAAEALAPRSTPEQVLDAARKASPKMAEDNARQQVHVAHGKGRMSALAQLPEPKRVYASELLDGRTCTPCATVDGREYDSLGSALIDYPDAGPYRACLGETRCRGTLVFVWAEDEPEDGIPEPQGPSTPTEPEPAPEPPPAAPEPDPLAPHATPPATMSDDMLEAAMMRAFQSLDANPEIMGWIEQLTIEADARDAALQAARTAEAKRQREIQRQRTKRARKAAQREAEQNEAIGRLITDEGMSEVDAIAEVTGRDRRLVGQQLALTREIAGPRLGAVNFEEYARQTYHAYLRDEVIPAAEAATRGAGWRNLSVELRFGDWERLWRSDEAFVRKYASDELKLWFDENGRLTFDQWKTDLIEQQPYGRGGRAGSGGDWLR